MYYNQSDQICNINIAKDWSKPVGQSLGCNQSDRVAGPCATVRNRRTAVAVRLRPNSQDKATGRVAVTSKMGKRPDRTGLLNPNDDGGKGGGGAEAG
jgi:hypothetical protein